MALLTSPLTRTNSSDSSALSNIVVAGAQEDDSASEGISASTPPTSLNDNGSLHSVKAADSNPGVIEEESLRRPKRARSRVSTYNITKLSETQQIGSTSSSRNVSGLTGRTLVDDEDPFAALGSKVDKDVDSASDSIAVHSPQRRSPRSLKRKPSVKDRVKKVAGKVGSVLGKRSRDAMEAGKRKFGMKEEEAKVLKELDTGTKGVLDELNLSDDEFVAPPPRPVKRAKIDQKALQDTKQTIPTAAPLKISRGKLEKKWQKEGLYVGQATDAALTQNGTKRKLQKKRPGSSSSETTAESGEVPPMKASFMPLPMFSYLDKARDFTIPFDIYAPSLKKGDEKPKDWYKINRNRLVGEAKELWEKEEKLPNSACVCNRYTAPGEHGCGEDCLNRVMQYECNNDNCSLPADRCSNRAFAELAARTKKGGAFDVGVEVLKTANRGFGVRSCRTFAPGQIIMEYTGEIISEGECQRRMRDEYMDKQCYYLMELERGLIIDGTKGSMARFINHSCSPNCEVRMVKVGGVPRMAVFAGENGIMTGEELTYDYNFDSFGAVKQSCYCGAPNCRGTLSKRLNAAEQKKQAKEDEERRLKAAEEAKKLAAKEAKKQQIKNDRGSSWRGWVAVDDPETKEGLKLEKKEKEEAAKNSNRAQRMAARRQSFPMPANKKKEFVPERISSSKRRKTTHSSDNTTTEEVTEEISTAAAPAVLKTVNKTHKRTASTSSKFTEEFDRPMSSRTTSKVIRETETETETISVSTTRMKRKVDVMEEDEDSTTAGAEETNLKEKSGLARTASKGKEALKQVGLAFKGGLLGFDKGKAGSGGSKLRQSTLSFAKLS